MPLGTSKNPVFYECHSRMLEAGIQPGAFVSDFPELDPRLKHSGMTVKTGFLEVPLYQNKAILPYLTGSRKIFDLYPSASAGRIPEQRGVPRDPSPARLFHRSSPTNALPSGASRL